MRDASSWSLNFGRFAGVPVRLHASFLVCGLWAIYFTKQASEKDLWAFGLLAVLLWLVSLFIHQSAHLLAAAKLGGQVDRIVIGPLGDMAPATSIHDSRHEVLINLAGLLGTAIVVIVAGATLLIAGEDLREIIFSPFGPTNLLVPNFWIVVLKLTFWINWLLLIVNLMPAISFDMGRALIAGFRSTLGEPGATLKVALGGALASSLIICVWSGMSNTGDDRPLVPAWLPLTMLLFHIFFATRHEFLKLGDEERDGDLIGYDFSQGYTSLESGAEQGRRREPGPIRRWLQQRRDEKLRRNREIELEEERRVDEILARVKDGGMESLAAEERALLQRVSVRYRNRQSNA